MTHLQTKIPGHLVTCIKFFLLMIEVTHKPRREYGRGKGKENGTAGDPCPCYMFRVLQSLLILTDTPPLR